MQLVRAASVITNILPCHAAGHLFLCALWRGAEGDRTSGLGFAVARGRALIGSRKLRLATVGYAVRRARELCIYNGCHVHKPMSHLACVLSVEWEYLCRAIVSSAFQYSRLSNVAIDPAGPGQKTRCNILLAHNMFSI